MLPISDIWPAVRPLSGSSHVSCAPCSVWNQAQLTCALDPSQQDCDGVSGEGVSVLESQSSVRMSMCDGECLAQNERSAETA